MIKLINFTNNGICSNCGECCTDFLHLSDDEIEKINNYLKEYKLPQHQKGLNTKCPFRNDLFGKCDIYSVRPHICRIFKCDTQPEQAEIIRDETNKERKPYSMAELFFNDSTKRKMLEALGINVLKGNKNEKDFEEFMKRKDIPQEIKSNIEKALKDLLLKEAAEKLHTATERFDKNYEKIFEKRPSKFNDTQMQLYTRALNKCSQILENLDKEMRIYE